MRAHYFESVADLCVLKVLIRLSERRSIYTKDTFLSAVFEIKITLPACYCLMFLCGRKISLSTDQVCPSQTGIQFFQCCINICYISHQASFGLCKLFVILQAIAKNSTMSVVHDDPLAPRGLTVFYDVIMTYAVPCRAASRIQKTSACYGNWRTEPSPFFYQLTIQALITVEVSMIKVLIPWYITCIMPFIIAEITWNIKLSKINGLNFGLNV